MTHAIETLPVLLIEAHSRCNCRCVMCDIWKANAAGRELSEEVLSAHVGAIRRLRVRRVGLDFSKRGPGAHC